MFRTRFCSVPSGHRPVGAGGMRARAAARKEPGDAPPGPPTRGPPLTGAPKATDPQQWLGHRLGLLFVVLSAAQLLQLCRSRTGQTQFQGVLSILDPEGRGGPSRRLEERKEKSAPPSSTQGDGGRLLGSHVPAPPQGPTARPPCPLPPQNPTVPSPLPLPRPGRASLPAGPRHLPPISPGVR